ncbi:hypothetical protein BD311DRAFT_747080 [Dichomitus squalens]|uniref:Uncharacterized protein n=1 Tax=Dichomitus squalens TaxID=114155 RepID=A0A4Q9N5E7_9APHY|nr:hypothetical protein BD311DRAFT_747080 [Dichomitus squalens]
MRCSPRLWRKHGEVESSAPHRPREALQKSSIQKWRCPLHAPHFRRPVGANRERRWILGVVAMAGPGMWRAVSAC